jgi:SAM-dependent methyltransferase
MNRVENEVKHGKYLAARPDEYWGWSGKAGRLRLERRATMLSDGLFGKVLEIGCGAGLYTTELSKAGIDLMAIDVSPDLIQLAIETVPLERNVSFRLEDAHMTSFPNQSFDAIIGSSVLHHLELSLALKEFLRILKPGGILRFTEPNYLNPQVALLMSHPFFRKRFHVSQDETAFFKWQLKKDLLLHGFSEIKIENFDFLHPQTPTHVASTLNRLTLLLERTPILKEISGSLFVTARK